MPSNDSSNWIRNLIIIPLIVGLILATVAFVLPRLFKEKKEISYTIDGPTSYLDDPAVESINIEVNGIKIEHLISYKLRIWNSGDLPLKNLPVRFSFGPKEQLGDFQIFSITHDTDPPYEFGQVKNDRSDKDAPRVVYELLNSKDQDIVTLLTNRKLNLNVYMKSEGVSVKQVTADGEQGVWWKYGSITAAILGIIGSVLGGIISTLGENMLSLYNKYVKRTKE